METDGLSYTPALKDFQKFIVDRALKNGCYALFEDCGMGKTIQQLEWARHVVAATGRPVLILTPLAVAAQTVLEGIKFGIAVERLIPNATFCSVLPPTIYVTNYEQLDNLNSTVFSGVVLDESSILKNFTGQMKQQLIACFNETPFRLCCTATPSPNDHMELGNHSEFLGVMSRATMLATYFVHDGGDTAKWRLKGHAKADFWKWVSTWSACLANPADLGFDGTDYVLPPLQLHEHVVSASSERARGQLFGEVAVSATTFNAELRSTLTDRMAAAAAIVQSLPAEPFIVWINQDAEADALRRLLPDAVEVRGSETPSAKERKLLAFANGDFRVLITKKKIAQFGLNFQHCANQVFAALDFSFEGLYQAIRRSYRFGQTRPVNVHLLTVPTMGNVLTTIKRKQAGYDTMRAELAAAISHHQTPASLFMATTPLSQVQHGRNFTLHLGDCCEQIQLLPDASIHFSVFSPPFADLYTYSGLTADMGNSNNYEEFVQHFNYLIPQLARVVMPGRNVAVHCMDLPIQKGKEGFIGLRDFSGTILRAFADAGFIYHDRITIWKDPVVEMQRTKSLGLLHKQLKKDSTMSRTGIPDYLLVFRNAGVNTIPVRQTVPVDTWQKWASPVWMDINYGKTLQRDPGRSEQDEKHICPLQLETIERAVALWTNLGETVFSPFAGIGSELFQSLKMGRKAIGIELKESYFNVAVANCKKAELGHAQLDMFSENADNSITI